MSDLVAPPRTITVSRLSQEKPPAQGKRRLSNFINTFLEYTKDMESPLIFRRWYGMSILAAAAGRRYRFKNEPTIYPMLYVLCIAPPGKSRKSTGINIAKELLRGITNITYSPESGSLERYVQVLAETGFDDIRDQTNAFILTDELGEIIRVSQERFTGFMTTVHNRKGDYKYDVKNNPRPHIIRSPVFNFLGATTPTYLREQFPVALETDGFTSRCIMAYSSEDMRKTKPRSQGFVLNENMKKALQRDLVHIHNAPHQRVMEFDHAASDYYDKLYVGDKVGEESRLELHYKQVAMLFAISENTMLISLAHLKRAEQWLDEQRAEYKKLSSTLNRSKNAQLKHEVEEYLEHNTKMSREKFFKIASRTINFNEATDILRVLTAAGVFRVSDDGDWLFRVKAQ